MFKNLFDRKFVTAFVVVLLINLLIITFVFSSGVYTGYEGTFGWDAAAFGNTIGSIFGSFTSFVLLLGTLALVAAVLGITHWLANRSRKIWVVLWVVVVAIVAAFVGPSVRFTDFSFTFVFAFILIVVTAIQVGTLRQILAPRASSTKTVVKTVTTKPAPKPASK